MALRAPNVLALCVGAGGLELGVKLALPGARLVGAVEREAFAAAVLVARMEDATLEAALVWDDLSTFDGRPWRGVVDLVTAGFPCQPISSAGRRQGDEDVRWLWPDVARVVGEVGPDFVFVENVPDLALWQGGRLLGVVLGSLADLGFHAEWCVLAAATVGATQLRERFFLLAYRSTASRRSSGASSYPTTTNPNDAEDPDNWLARAATLKEKHGNGNGVGMPLAIAAQLWPSPQARDARALPSIETAEERWRAGRRNLDDAVSIAASRLSRTTSRRGQPRETVLNPQFDEWLMGWPIGWTEYTRSATESYRWWRQLHSSVLRAVLASWKWFE